MSIALGMVASKAADGASVIDDNERPCMGTSSAHRGASENVNGKASNVEGHEDEGDIRARDRARRSLLSVEAHTEISRACTIAKR